MCGVAGFCDFNKHSSNKILAGMTDSMVHRGPDGSGLVFEENQYAQIGLGHRRLSIIDLTEQGSQPMNFNHLTITYNGEVYNFSEIKKELIETGYTFQSHSDTEVLLKAFHKWGTEAVHKFIGMFAIALYDKEKEELTLIRDRSGVKPLYYYCKKGTFLFGSELKSLFHHPSFEKNLNIDALALYLKNGYIPVPYSIFKDCHKLKPGHYLTLDLKTGNSTLKKYWDIIDFYNTPDSTLTETETIEKCEELMTSAFKYRMVSDVPVGVFLSGGYDSTAVAAILQKNNTEKLKTFTIGFDDTSFNEAVHAKNVASYLGTDHHEYYCTPKDALDILPELPIIYDEPFGDSSAIPTILVSRFARKHVTVALSADAGDELFGGYGKYFGDNFFLNTIEKLPYSFRKLFLSVAGEMEHLHFIKNIKNRTDQVTRILSAEFTERVKIENFTFSEEELNLLFINKPKTLRTNLDDFGFLRKDIGKLNRMLSIDYKTYLLDDILTKVDRASMSVSLEGREPLLDHRLAEFIATVPQEIKYKNKIPKYILKTIVHKYVPKKIMERPKMGFGIPLVKWFRNEMKEYMLYYLNEERIRKAGIMDPSYVTFLSDQYFDSDKLSSDHKNFLFTKLWYILNFEMWREKWMGIE